MIRYQKISGITLEGNAGLPRVQITPEGRAMGAVPGWSVFLDPSYSQINPQYIRNRAQPDGNDLVSDGSFEYDEINGNTAFLMTNEAGGMAHRPQKGNIDPDRWTVFFVGADMVATKPTAIPRIIAPVDDTLEGVALNFGYNSTGAAIVLYEQAQFDPGNPIRLRYDPLTPLFVRESPTLIMATFSVERGINIFDGGSLVKSEPNDTRPLTIAIGKEESRWFRFVRGKFGMCGLLNTDLSAPENTGHRRAIERFLMTKYGIPEGPQ